MASIFLNKTVTPNDKMLRDAIGKTYPYWIMIKETLKEEYGTLNEEWKFYGASSGWTLKTLLKKRNLFFFIPYDNYFLIGFVFGDKAVAAAKKSTLPVKLVDELTNAKRYAEGRGLRIEVKKKSDVKNIITLVSIKVDN